MNRVVLYDLSRMPTTFDFACTAVMAKTLGYEEIRFVVDKPMTEWKYPASIGWRRWANILIPICSLADLMFSVGAEGIDGDVLGYTTGDVERLYLKTGKIAKLRSVINVKDENYVTVTMRTSFRNQWRNSDRPQWEKIIKWLEDRGETVVIVEECESQPMPIEHRMALYANARMNLAVGNGPMVLCWLSEAPYLTFQLPNRIGREKQYDELVQQWARLGFPVGSQLSFRNDKQEIIWGPDDLETVTEAYKRFVTNAELTGNRKQAKPAGGRPC